MSTETSVESAQVFWSEEPSKLPGRRRIRARIGGLHCSLCTGTIEKALGRIPGVDKVAVLAPDRIALGPFRMPTPPHVDHHLAVRHLHRQPVGKQVQPAAMRANLLA